MTNRRISPQIRMNTGESGREAFERFLLFKRADGVKIKSLESYSQHFKAIKNAVVKENKIIIFAVIAASALVVSLGTLAYVVNRNRKLEKMLLKK